MSSVQYGSNHGQRKEPEIELRYSANYSANLLNYIFGCRVFIQLTCLKKQFTIQPRIADELSSEIDVFLQLHAFTFGFFAGSQKKFAVWTLQGPNLFALLEACNRGQNKPKKLLELYFILSKYLLKFNCLKIFIYGQDCQLMNKI